MVETGPVRGWRDLAGALPAVVGVSSGDEFVYVATELAAVAGCTVDALVGEHWELLFERADGTPFDPAAIERARATGRWTGEARIGDDSPAELDLVRTERGAIVWVLDDRSDGGPLPIDRSPVADDGSGRDPLPDRAPTADSAGPAAPTAADAASTTPDPGTTADAASSANEREVTPDTASPPNDRTATADVTATATGSTPDDRGDGRSTAAPADRASTDGAVADENARSSRAPGSDLRSGFARTLLDVIDDVVYVIDEDGDARFWNEALVETTGYSHAEIAAMDPVDLIPADHHEYVPGLMEAIEAIEDRRVEVDIETADGRRITHEFMGTTFEDPETGEQFRCGVARDVSERKEYERLLQASERRYRRLIETAPVPVWVQREETLLYLNDAAAAFFGADDPADVVGRSDLEFVVPEERERSRERNRRILEEGVILPEMEGRKVGLDGEVRHGLFAGAPIRFEGDDAILVIGRDITDRRERERELERYERIIETVDDGIYVLDEDLRFTFVNDALCAMAGQSRESLLGTPVTALFATADEAETAERLRRQVLEGETSTGTVQAPHSTPEGERSLEARYRLYPEPDGDEFRGSVGVVRDVTEREHRERALERQRDALATFDRINDLLLETARELIQTSSRDAVEETICERLAESDLYQFAWVGERERDGDRIVPRTSAGEGDGYLESVTITADERPTGQGPGGQAMRTGDVQVASVGDPSFEPWRGAARERGFESVAAVPLRHGETVYGVLVVYATREDAFGERERAGFDTLGRTVGFVIHAARSRELLFADAVVELEFDVTDTDSAIVGAAAGLDCTLGLDGYVPSDAGWLLYLSVQGAPPEAVGEIVAEDPQVERARTIVDTGDTGRIEVVAAESSLLHAVTAAGATLRTASAGADGARIVVEAPVDADVRRIVDHVENAFPASELVARRETDRDVTTVGRPGGILADLTDRQRDVIEAAYRAGYFTWPRESTAEEIAASLDLSPPTLHGHLRKAERAILAALLDGE